MIKNLWNETIEVLGENGFTFNDVKYVFGDDFQITKENFKDVAENTYYDNGYGAQEVASDLVLLGEAFVMIRWEYDGSEGWQLIHFKNKTKEIKKIKALSSRENCWCTLSEINNTN